MGRVDLSRYKYEAQRLNLECWNRWFYRLPVAAYCFPSLFSSFAVTLTRGSAFSPHSASYASYIFVPRRCLRMPAYFWFCVRREKAIISVCDCCCDSYLTTNRAVRALNQMHTPKWSASESSSSTPSVWFGVVLSFFYSPSLFPPCSVFCAPVFADPVPSQRPPNQRVQKAAKIKKKAVCNKSKTKKRKTLWPPSSHFLF